MINISFFSYNSSNYSMKFTISAIFLGLACTLTRCQKKPQIQLDTTALNSNSRLNNLDSEIRFDTTFQNGNVQGDQFRSQSNDNYLRLQQNIPRRKRNEGDAAGGSYQSFVNSKNTQSATLQSSNQFNREAIESNQGFGNFQRRRGGASQQDSDLSQINSYRQSSAQILNQASKNYGAGKVSFNNLFVKFPSCSEVDQLIISADSVAILKTIQKVASDNTVSCQARINYLMQLLGRIRTAIEKKVRLADQLKIVITSAQNQINRLGEEINTLKRSLDGLGLDALKEEQRRLNKQLEIKYTTLNMSQSQAPVLKAKLLGIEKQIDILTKNNEVERNRIASDKLQLNKVNSDISNIESKLRQLQDRQAVLRESINKGQSRVAQNDNNIKILRKKIQDAEIQLRKYKNGYDQANAIVKELQLKVQRLRSDISVAESKKDKYSKQISVLESKINVQKKKAFPDNLDRLNQMIITLKDLIPSVEKSIDSHYYNCYGAGSNIKVDGTGNVIVYMISGDRFGDYIKNLYGQNIKFSTSPNEIALNKVNIFSPDWTGVHGYPFLDNAFGSQDFSFAGSFSCLNPNSVSKGWGIIKNIGSNFIEAEDQKGNQQRFNLGSCSRLESTLKTPKVGQKFYWSGVIGSRGFNLYSGSCLE